MEEKDYIIKDTDVKYLVGPVEYVRKEDVLHVQTWNRWDKGTRAEGERQLLTNWAETMAGKMGCNYMQRGIGQGCDFIQPYRPVRYE